MLLRSADGTERWRLAGERDYAVLIKFLFKRRHHLEKDIIRLQGGLTTVTEENEALKADKQKLYVSTQLLGSWQW